jgi:hypothetical protein
VAASLPAAAPAAAVLSTASQRTAAALVRAANSLADAWAAAMLRLWMLASAGASRALRALLLAAVRAVPCLRAEAGRRALLSSLSFGAVLTAALAFPDGFLSGLEVFTSLALNISCGWLVARMFVAPPGSGEVAQQVAWAVPAPWRRVLPAFALVTFGAAVVYDVLETLARFTGWSAAVYLALALADLTLHERGLLRHAVERVAPPAADAIGYKSHSPFLRLVVWANMAMLECLALSTWSGVACDAGDSASAALALWSRLATGALLAAVLLNEVAAAAAVAASGLGSGPRRNGRGSWLLRRAPVALSYAAGLAATGGAVALSACGCGASASVAFYALFVQMACVAAAFLCGEASEGEPDGGGGVGGGEESTLLAVVDYGI